MTSRPAGPLSLAAAGVVTVVIYAIIVSGEWRDHVAPRMQLHRALQAAQTKQVKRILVEHPDLLTWSPFSGSSRFYERMV